MYAVKFVTVPDGAREGQFIHLPEEAEEARRLMALTPEYCRVVGLGWADVSGGEPASKLVGEQVEAVTVSEELLLKKFWQLYRSGLVGYNLAGFELPVALVRSALLGVEPAYNPGLKPWEHPYVDLMLARYGRRGALSLVELAAAYREQVALPVRLGGEMESRDAPQWWYDREYGRLHRYLQQRVAIICGLYRHWKGYFFP